METLASVLLAVTCFVVAACVVRHIDVINCRHAAELARVHERGLAAVLECIKSLETLTKKDAEISRVATLSNRVPSTANPPTQLVLAEDYADPTDIYLPPLPAGSYDPDLDRETPSDPGPFGYDDYGPDLTSRPLTPVPLTPAPWTPPVWTPRQKVVTS